MCASPNPPNTDNLLQAAHRTTDYMYIDTGVENSSLYRAATAGLEANTDNLLQAAHRTTDYMYIDTGVENSSLYRAATAGLSTDNCILEDE